MNQPSASTAIAVSATQPNVGETRLRGRWLILARMIWLAVAALDVALFALSLPIGFARTEQACTGPACGHPHLTPQDILTLKQLGLSAAFFATYFAVFTIVFALVWLAVGALIFWRKSDEPRALFFSLFLVSFGTIWTMDPRTTLAAVHPVWWLPAAAGSFLNGTCLTLFFYLFPDGRFAPRWTRWLAFAAILLNVPTFFFPDSPLSIDNWPQVLNALFFLGFLGFAIWAQVYRYRHRSTPVQRQQTKLVVLAIVTSLLIYSLPTLFGETNGLLEEFAGGTLLYLALLLIPLAIAISILRYRLWDVDTLINKALVYGLLTGLLAAVYAGLVIGLQSLVRLLTGTIAEQPLVIVASTLAIAALFQPLRRRIQVGIDRRFYRRKYDAARTLATFSTTLRHELDLSQLSEQLMAVVQETMQPTFVSLWLRPSEHDRKHRAPWRANPPVSPERR